MTTNENVDPERGGATRTGEPREALPKEQQPSLERGLGLKEAVALNMIEIVGIGPFVVSSLVIRAMGGPQALIAWLAGALLRSEEHTSELQSHLNLVCRLLLE